MTNVISARRSKVDIRDDEREIHREGLCINCTPLLGLQYCNASRLSTCFPDHIVYSLKCIEQTFQKYKATIPTGRVFPTRLSQFLGCSKCKLFLYICDMGNIVRVSTLHHPSITGFVLRETGRRPRAKLA